MIARYARPQMQAIWSDAWRFARMLEVERAAQQELESRQLPSPAHREAAAHNVRELSSLLGWILEHPENEASWIDCILRHETRTRHETLAFLAAIEELRPSIETRLLHLGLTSSDALDSALALQLKQAGNLIIVGLEKTEATLRALAERHASTLMCGRTHGMTAEPTTFGFKLMSFAEEFLRSNHRLKVALDGACIGKLSGAVGTAQFFGPEFEAAALGRLGLSRERVATQVVARDRHAWLVCTLSVIGGSIERLCTELRHLQRSEVAEVHEGFVPGQQGSSAMPHKKNPISAENLTGCARLLRSHAVAALENQALWHERDMSHSSVERVILPDAFILLDYALNRLDTLLSNLQVDEARMLALLKSDSRRAFSSQRLFDELTAPDSASRAQAPTRAKAYEKIQSESFKQASSAQSLTELAGELNSELNGSEFEQRSQRVLNATRSITDFNLRSTS
ncbi:MAG: adenylosuccinate lyase [Oligoflexia bacterium]